MKIPRSAVLLMLIVFSGPGVAEICKWVDESGVVHYAETCPENVDSTEIETQALPSQEQVEEAVRRLEQLQEKRKVQREFKNQQAEKRAAEKQQLRAKKGAQTELCVEARSNLQVLGTSRPVYYDEVGKLHIQWLFDSNLYLITLDSQLLRRPSANLKFLNESRSFQWPRIECNFRKA